GAGRVPRARWARRPARDRAPGRAPSAGSRGRPHSAASTARVRSARRARAPAARATRKAARTHRRSPRARPTTTPRSPRASEARPARCPCSGNRLRSLAPMVLLLRWLGRLPLAALYGVARFMYFVTFHLLRWRRDVAERNLARSFPEKTEAERAAILEQSYRN